MIKFCKYAWDQNESKLRKALKDSEPDFLRMCSYKDLVYLIVKNIFNNGQDRLNRIWDAEKITEIDDGDYQGTLLFTIPEDTYQPSPHQYLMTYVDYGSCSGCDTLLNVQMYIPYEGDVPDSSINDFLTLCRDIVANTVCPFNNGWRKEDIFDPAEDDE